ncbi:MAG: glucokinase [Solidesulfovibrio sp.]
MTPTAPGTTRNILAADIGGTNSRFGHFTLSPAGVLELAATAWLPTASVDSFIELITSLPDAGFPLRPGAIDAAVFAVPGAVIGRSVTFANIGWELDLDALQGLFGLARIACINDFLAQAHGCRLLGDTAEIVRPGDMNPNQVQAVIGAGTGLGKAALVPVGDSGYHVLPSEGGQTAASFTGKTEVAFAEALCRATGERYVRGDSVVSGSGLTHLHRFLTGQNLSPAEISAALTPDSETAALFARFYGRAVRDYALTLLAVGGVYISGGVAAKNPLLVRHPEFSREFCDSPTYGPLLTQIPVRLVRDERTGLFGAARFAQTLLSRAS